MRRWPCPAALADRAAPMTSVASASLGWHHEGSNTRVARQSRHRPRRGRTTAAEPSNRRTRRVRAHDQGRNGPPHPGQPIRPAARSASARSASSTTITAEVCGHRVSLVHRPPSGTGVTWCCRPPPAPSARHAPNRGRPARTTRTPTRHHPDWCSPAKVDRPGDGEHQRLPTTTRVLTADDGSGPARPHPTCVGTVAAQSTVRVSSRAGPASSTRPFPAPPAGDQPRRHRRRGVVTRPIAQSSNGVSCH